MDPIIEPKDYSRGLDALGVSRTVAAEMLGVDRVTLWRRENGSRRISKSAGALLAHLLSKQGD